MTIIVVANGSGRLSSGQACDAAAYVADTVAPAAAAARETMGMSCIPSNPSSLSASAPSFTTTCSSSSYCASGCGSSSSCATCPFYAAMPWTEDDAEVTNRHENENKLKDRGGHDDRGIGDGNREEMQRQRPFRGVTEREPLHPSSPVGPRNNSQPTQPAMRTTLSCVDKEARSMLSTPVPKACTYPYLSPRFPPCFFSPTVV